MRSKCPAAVGIVLASCALAQNGAGPPAGRPIYFLKDDMHAQWCAYASETRFKAQVQSLRAMIVGQVDYTNGHASALHITEADETGDWAVNDDYALDGRGNIRALKRMINIIPEDTSEQQLFIVKDGRAIPQGGSSRELRSGKPTQKRVDWFQPPPVITSLKALPFSGLVTSKQQTVWSKGEDCVPDSRK